MKFYRTRYRHLGITVGKESCSLLLFAVHIVVARNKERILSTYPYPPCLKYPKFSGKFATTITIVAVGPSVVVVTVSGTRSF